MYQFLLFLIPHYKYYPNLFKWLCLFRTKLPKRKITTIWMCLQYSLFACCGSDEIFPNEIYIHFCIEGVKLISIWYYLMCNLPNPNCNNILCPSNLCWTFIPQSYDLISNSSKFLYFTIILFMLSQKFSFNYLVFLFTAILSQRLYNFVNLVFIYALQTLYALVLCYFIN